MAQQPQAALVGPVARTAAVAAAAALAAAALGLAIPQLGDKPRLALAGLSGLVLLAGLAHFALAPAGPVTALAPPSAATTETRRRPIAWLLFGAGMLTLGLPALRVRSVTISDLFFLASLGAAVAGTRPGAGRARGARLLPGPLVAGTMVFAAGGLVASAAAIDSLASVAVVLRVLFLFLAWFWLAATVIDSRARVLAAARLWVVSAAISGLAAAIQAVFGDVVPGGQVHWGRMTGFTQHVNDLGGVCGIALIPAAMLATSPMVRRSIAARVLSLAVLVFVAVGLVLSSSFSGLAATVTATAVWLGAGGRRAIAPLATLACLGTVAIVLAGSLALDLQSPLDRLGLGSDTAGSPVLTLRSRDAIASTALDSLASQPVLGRGLDRTSIRVSRDGQEVHNLLLGAWFEAGLPGLLGVVAVLVTIAVVSVRVVVGAGDEPTRLAAVALTAAFLGAAVFAMAQPVLYQRYVWAPAALLLALAAQRRDPTPSPP